MEDQIKNFTFIHRNSVHLMFHLSRLNEIFKVNEPSLIFQKFRELKNWMDISHVLINGLLGINSWTELRIVSGNGLKNIYNYPFVQFQVQTSNFEMTPIFLPLISKIKKLGKLDHKLRGPVFSTYEKRAIPTSNTDYISYGKRYDALSFLNTEEYF